MTPQRRPSPLDDWLRARIGCTGKGAALVEALTRRQHERLQRVIADTRRRSPFYRRHLVHLPEGFPARLEDLAAAPFTAAADLRRHHLDMVCVSLGAVARVVTLRTSGSTAAPKRLFFSDDDLELTVDFFHHGMTTLAGPGSRVLILMPGRTPGSIGDLLHQALGRLHAIGRVHGPVQDPARAVADLCNLRADCVVGLPAQVLGLARHPCADRIPAGMVKRVLLSADYVPASLAADLTRRWGATVFEHYGMTEMGLGGGVQCADRNGYHLREADLYVEVVDPASGKAVPDGEPGEVVFTTLTRQAMPLIRYRTGDRARMLPGPCPCGSPLRRLGKVRGRIDGARGLGNGGALDLPEMDEALYGVPDLIAYRAAIERGGRRDVLAVTVHTRPEHDRAVRTAVHSRLGQLPAVRAAVSDGCLQVRAPIRSPALWPDAAPLKRSLTELRQPAPNPERTIHGN